MRRELNSNCMRHTFGVCGRGGLALAERQWQAVGVTKHQQQQYGQAALWICSGVTHTAWTVQVNLHLHCLVGIVSIVLCLSLCVMFAARMAPLLSLLSPVITITHRLMR